MKIAVSLLTSSDGEISVLLEKWIVRDLLCSQFTVALINVWP